MITLLMPVTAEGKKGHQRGISFEYRAAAFKILRYYNWNFKTKIQVRNIDKKKTKTAVEYKLIDAKNCLKRRMRFFIRNKFYSLNLKSVKRDVKRLEKSKSFVRKIVKDNRAKIVLTLNRYGRNISFKFLKAPKIPELQECLRWYLEGRKYFPPENRKRGLVRIETTIKFRSLR